jgi:hypothetical protein
VTERTRPSKAAISKKSNNAMAIPPASAFAQASSGRKILLDRFENVRRIKEPVAEIHLKVGHLQSARFNGFPAPSDHTEVPDLWVANSRLGRCVAVLAGSDFSI